MCHQQGVEIEEVKEVICPKAQSTVDGLLNQDGGEILGLAGKPLGSLESQRGDHMFEL